MNKRVRCKRFERLAKRVPVQYIADEAMPGKMRKRVRPVVVTGDDVALEDEALGSPFSEQPAASRDEDSHASLAHAVAR